MFKEYKQLNEGPIPRKPIFGTINPSDLRPECKKMALEEVNLIRQKRYGRGRDKTVQMEEIKQVPQIWINDIIHYSVDGGAYE